MTYPAGRWIIEVCESVRLQLTDATDRSHSEVLTHQKRCVHLILVSCWASVTHGGRTLKLTSIGTTVKTGRWANGKRLATSNMRYWFTVFLMVGRRRRRWTSIEITLVQCPVFARYRMSATAINPFKPEFTIVIFIHYKSRIAVAILDLWMKMTRGGLKIKENCHVLLKHFHGNFRSKTLWCGKIKSVFIFRDVKWCFNASWGLKGLMVKVTLVTKLNRYHSFERNMV